MAGRDRPTRPATCFLRQPELVDELAERARLVHGVEVGALEVLDERQGQLLLPIGGAHHGRDPLEAGQLGRAQAPLAGDQLESSGTGVTRMGWSRPCSAMLAARSRSATGSKVRRGWYGLATTSRDRDLARPLVLCHRGDQRRQAPPEPARGATCFHGHAEVTQAGWRAGVAGQARRRARRLATPALRATSSAASSRYAWAPRELGL